MYAPVCVHVGTLCERRGVQGCGGCGWEEKQGEGRGLGCAHTWSVWGVRRKGASVRGYVVWKGSALSRRQSGLWAPRALTARGGAGGSRARCSFSSRALASSRLRKGQRLGRSQGLSRAQNPSPELAIRLRERTDKHPPHPRVAGNSTGLTWAFLPDQHLADQSGQGTDYRLQKLPVCGVPGPG